MCQADGVEACVALKFQRKKGHEQNHCAQGQETLAQTEQRTDTNHSKVMITKKPFDYKLISVQCSYR